MAVEGAAECSWALRNLLVLLPLFHDERLTFMLPADISTACMFLAEPHTRQIHLSAEHLLVSLFNFDRQNKQNIRNNIRAESLM